MTAISDTWALTVRDLLRLWRQPWFIAIVLVQPVIWLLLFGELFGRVVDIPGFHATDYKQYLVPGVLVMTAAGTGCPRSRTSSVASPTACS
jgi:ABC-2 type transport system permease protein